MLSNHARDKARRNHEREVLLLLIGALFVGAGALSLYIQRGSANPSSLILWLVWVTVALVGAFALSRWLPQRDPFLFPIAMLLCGWGLLMIERVAPNFADRQAIWLLIAAAAMIVTAVQRSILTLLRRYRYTLLVSGLVLLLTTIMLGQNPSGIAGAPQLWLGAGTVYFQPSELLKTLLVVFLASYLGEHHLTLRTIRHDPQTTSLTARFTPRVFGPILFMWGMSIIILIWQRDMGTAILFFIVFTCLIYLASGRISVLIIGAILIVIAGGFAYLLFGVVRLRIDIWIDPWADSAGRSYQIVQSLMAFAAGGVFGQGLGQGSPVYIPVVHSDFIFPALAEEYGLLGVSVIVACTGIFFARGIRIATQSHKRPFQALLAAGLALLFIMQSLMIIGGVLKLIPLTGITQPYISYGGSSLLINFINLGLLLRLSNEAAV